MVDYHQDVLSSNGRFLSHEILTNLGAGEAEIIDSDGHSVSWSYLDQACIILFRSLLSFNNS